MQTEVTLREQVYQWLRERTKVEEITPRTEKIVMRIVVAIESQKLPLNLAPAVCAIGGYIFGHRKPIETKKVYEALKGEYTENTIRVALWVGRKANIFKGGYRDGLVWFTDEFAKFLGLRPYEIPETPRSLQAKTKMRKWLEGKLKMPKRKKE